MTSSLAALGLGAAGAVSVVLTATLDDAGEIAVSGALALSVTLSSKVYVEPAVRALDGTEHVTGLPAVAPVPLLLVEQAAALM